MEQTAIVSFVDFYKSGGFTRISSLREVDGRLVFTVSTKDGSKTVVKLGRKTSEMYSAGQTLAADDLRQMNVRGLTSGWPTAYLAQQVEETELSFD